jgi:hypothetical protein
MSSTTGVRFLAGAWTFFLHHRVQTGTTIIPITSSSFSPDLAPYQEVKTACSTILLKIAANCLQRVFEKWVDRCKKWIACQGRYFEKETVTAPPQSFVSE